MAPCPVGEDQKKAWDAHPDCKCASCSVLRAVVKEGPKHGRLADWEARLRRLQRVHESDGSEPPALIETDKESDSDLDDEEEQAVDGELAMRRANPARERAPDARAMEQVLDHDPYAHEMNLGARQDAARQQRVREVANDFIHVGIVHPPAGPIIPPPVIPVDAPQVWVQVDGLDGGFPWPPDDADAPPAPVWVNGLVGGVPWQRAEFRLDDVVEPDAWRVAEDPFFAEIPFGLARQFDPIDPADAAEQARLRPIDAAELHERVERAGERAERRRERDLFDPYDFDWGILFPPDDNGQREREYCFFCDDEKGQNEDMDEAYKEMHKYHAEHFGHARGKEYAQILRDASNGVVKRAAFDPSVRA